MTAALRLGLCAVGPDRGSLPSGLMPRRKTPHVGTQCYRALQLVNEFYSQPPGCFANPLPGGAGSILMFCRTRKQGRRADRVLSVGPPHRGWPSRTPPAMVATLRDHHDVNADWIAAVGQVAGAIFTAAAVVAALWIALHDAKRQRDADAQRRDEDLDRDHRRAISQARLVHISWPDYVGYKNSSRTTIDQLSITNRSDRPILDASMEIWTDRDCLDRSAPFQSHAKMLLPGKTTEIRPPCTDGTQQDRATRPITRAWRVHWTDADGRHWTVGFPENDLPHLPPWRGRAGLDARREPVLYEDHPRPPKP